MAHDAPMVCTAAEALDRLRAGNARFAAGEGRFQPGRPEALAALVEAQRPYATILGCSDSRVPPELLFDAGFGELFVVRLAGNVFSAEGVGSMQYAGAHLRTPLFLVLGHEGCGAVKAALDAKFRGARDRSRIEQLLAGILPGLEGIDPAADPAAQLRAGVEANVRWTMRQILASPEGQARQAEGVMKVVGAVADLASGRVRFLDQP
jgi:carbonic anhydrase